MWALIQYWTSAKTNISLTHPPSHFVDDIIHWWSLSTYMLYSTPRASFASWRSGVYSIWCIPASQRVYLFSSIAAHSTHSALPDLLRVACIDVWARRVGRKEGNLWSLLANASTQFLAYITYSFYPVYSSFNVYGRALAAAVGGGCAVQWAVYGR